MRAKSSNNWPKRVRIRVLVYDPAKVAECGRAAEVIKGDLSKPENLAAAFAGRTEILSSPPTLSLMKLEANALAATKSIRQAFSET
jgi:hypothetical protein